MRVLITGSEGVLGSVLKEELRRRGNEVYGCDLAHSQDKMVMRADIRERRQIARVFDFARPQLVYHFAAEFGRKNGQEYYEQLWSTNMIGTRNVIEECLRIKRTEAQDCILAFASSSEAYGLSEGYSKPGDPLHEGLLDTNVPKFHNEYSLSKWVNERQIHTAVRNDNLDAIILRFFNVYGPPEKFSPYRSVVCQFIYKMLCGDPVTVNREGCRSHLWIGDWCDTVANLADYDKCLSIIMNTRNWSGSADCPYTPVFNIGSEDYEPITHLYERLLTMIPRAGMDDDFIDKEEANTATKRPDTTAARTWLDHYPKMGLDEGLALTIKWMKKEYSL